MMGKVQCDAAKAKFKLESSSAENCAYVCLNSSVINSDSFKCLSFDYCVDTKLCAFYSFSHLTDPSVVTQTAPFCDHYSSKKSPIQIEKFHINKKIN